MNISSDEKETLISIYNKPIVYHSQQIADLEKVKKFIHAGQFELDVLIDIKKMLKRERGILVLKTVQFSGAERIQNKINIQELDTIISKVDTEIDFKKNT